MLQPSSYEKKEKKEVILNFLVVLFSFSSFLIKPLGLFSGISSLKIRFGVRFDKYVPMPREYTVYWSSKAHFGVVRTRTSTAHRGRVKESWFIFLSWWYVTAVWSFCCIAACNPYNKFDVFCAKLIFATQRMPKKKTPTASDDAFLVNRRGRLILPYNL